MIIMPNVLLNVVNYVANKTCPIKRKYYLIPVEKICPEVLTYFNDQAVLNYTVNFYTKRREYTGHTTTPIFVWRSRPGTDINSQIEATKPDEYFIYKLVDDGNGKYSTYVNYEIKLPFTDTVDIVAIYSINIESNLHY